MFIRDQGEKKSFNFAFNEEGEKKKKKVVLFLHCAPVVDTVNLIMSLNISLNRLHRPLTARKVEVKKKKYSDNQGEKMDVIVLGHVTRWTNDVHGVSPPPRQQFKVAYKQNGSINNTND